MRRLSLLLLAAAALLAGCGDKDKKEPAAAAGATAEARPDTPEPAEAAGPAMEAPRKLLAVGAKAPGFTMEAHTGATIELAALRGQRLVLYFYPKDETPG